MEQRKRRWPAPVASASGKLLQTTHSGHWASCHLPEWCPGWGDQMTAVAHLQGLAASWMGMPLPMATEQALKPLLLSVENGRLDSWQVELALWGKRLCAAQSCPKVRTTLVRTQSSCQHMACGIWNLFSAWASLPFLPRRLLPQCHLIAHGLSWALMASVGERLVPRCTVLFLGGLLFASVPAGDIRGLNVLLTYSAPQTVRP